MSTYTDEQDDFAKDIARLIMWCDEQNYEISFGEGWRPPFVAEIYHKQGKGSLNSLHIDRLAHDLIIRKEGKEVGVEDYKRVGTAWKQLSPNNAWGGDFKGKTAGDYQHFSRAYGGRK
jgi:hypothetical protein